MNKNLSKFSIFVLIFIIAITVLPPLLIPPGVDYRNQVKDFDYGKVIFRNTSIGRYSSDDILHQIDVSVMPTADELSCNIKPVSIDIQSNGQKLNWDFYAHNKPRISKSAPIYIFTNGQNFESAIPLTFLVQFQMLGGCQQPDTFHVEHTIEPKKYRYWIWSVIFEAFMGV